MGYLTKSSPARCGHGSPTRRVASGASRTTSISSVTAATSPSSAGAQDCPYTYMRDLVAGKYRLPWEDEVLVTDGTSCGIPATQPPLRGLIVTAPHGGPGAGLVAILRRVTVLKCGGAVV